MKLKDIYLPYSDKQKINYSPRLLMEINGIAESEFRFYKFYNIASGVRVSGFSGEQRIYYIKIVFSYGNPIKHIDIATLKAHYKNISIYEFTSSHENPNPMYVMDINYYSDESTRNMILDNIEYLYFIAMRFKSFIDSDEYIKQKQKFKKAQ